MKHISPFVQRINRFWFAFFIIFGIAFIVSLITQKIFFDPNVSTPLTNYNIIITDDETEIPSIISPIVDDYKTTESTTESVEDLWNNTERVTVSRDRGKGE